MSIRQKLKHERERIIKEELAKSASTFVELKSVTGLNSAQLNRALKRLIEKGEVMKEKTKPPLYGLVAPLPSAEEGWDVLETKTERWQKQFQPLYLDAFEKVIHNLLEKEYEISRHEAEYPVLMLGTADVDSKAREDIYKTGVELRDKIIKAKADGVLSKYSEDVKEKIMTYVPMSILFEAKRDCERTPEIYSDLDHSLESSRYEFEHKPFFMIPEKEKDFLRWPKGFSFREEQLGVLILYLGSREVNKTWPYAEEYPYEEMPDYFERNYKTFNDFILKVLEEASLILVQVNLNYKLWEQISSRGYIFLRDLWNWLLEDIERWTVDELNYFRDIVKKILKGKEREVEKLHVRFHYPSFHVPFRGPFHTIDIGALLSYNPAKKRKFWKDLLKRINNLFEKYRRT